MSARKSDGARDPTDALLGPRDASGDLDVDGERIQASLRAKMFGVPGAPVRIGRFKLLGTIGSGGMGVVYSARDEELARKVAVKLLHGDVGRADEDRADLIREAQALARLSHPNVVQVYEVGTFDGRVYLAMEHLPGPTLAQWQSEETRPWRDVLEFYLQAGEGLAAAHAEGLVHRDLKPANLLVGGDGRVRVVDFGLARRVERQVSEARDPAEAHEEAIEALVSSTGLAGTPAYMSPEQVQRGSVDARSDQYSFAVAVYEALFGQRPHAGNSAPAVLFEISAGHVRPPPRGTAVPSHVSRAIMRALAHDPSDRFPSMAALLTELRRDPYARRKQVLGVAAIAALLAVAAWPAAQADPCAGATAGVDRTWTPELHEIVEAAFAATRLPYAGRAWDEVESKVDTWTSQWRVHREETCTAHHVDRAQSAELHDLRVACLDRALGEVDALLDELRRADTTVVRNAAASVADLPSLSQCASVDRVRRRSSAPEDPRTEGVERAIAQAAALDRVGRYEEAVSAAAEAVQIADALDYPPLVAEALRQRAWTSGLQTRHGEAIEDLHRAADLAEAAGEDELLTDLWIRLANAAARDDQRDLTRFAIRRATAGLSRTDGSDEDNGHLDMARARLALATGELEQAQLHARTGLARLERALGPQAPAAALGHRTLASVLATAGAYDEALDEYQRAYAARRKLLGDDHPDLAIDDYNIGRTLVELQRLDEAREQLNDGVRRRSTLEGGPDVALLDLYLLLFTLERSAGKASEAAELVKLAYESASGLSTTNYRWAMVALARAEVHLRADEWSEALALYERISDELRAQGKTLEYNFWVAQYGIGDAYVAMGRYREALAHLREVERRRAGAGLGEDVAPLAPLRAALAIAQEHVRAATDEG